MDEQKVMNNDQDGVEIKRGIYRHYKGNEYRFICVAANTGTKEELVIYESLVDSHYWARPKAEFLGEVDVAGEKKPRFEFVNEEAEESFEHKYLRALADYQNLLKQTAKDREDFMKYALNDFLQNILPIYDHLKMSLSGISESESQSAWATGVKHVLKQFKEVLSQHGIEEIKTVGETFDHNTMEAIDGRGETVKQEVMPGYKLNGKVIKPAKVIVE